MADETKEKLSEEKTEEEKEPAKSASRVILDYVVWIGAVVLISFLLMRKLLIRKKNRKLYRSFLKAWT